MIPRRSEFIARLAARVGRVGWLKAFFTPFYYIYRRIFVIPLTQKRNELFRTNAINVLNDFDSCMVQNGFDYTLAFGTMLGAVREHGFIQHDLDLDVAMWIDQHSQSFRDCMLNAGFNLLHELTVDNGKSGLELTYYKDDVTIDIFFVYPAIDKYPYCCDFLAVPGSASFAHSMERFGRIIARRLQLPWTREYIRVPFANLQLPICKNADEILAFRYGPDYLIPNPKWHYTDTNQYTTVWEEKKGVANVYN